MFGKKNKRTEGSIALSEQKRTLHRNLSFTALEQYKLLRTNLSFTLPDDVRCPIIGVTSANRGEGKSTTAVNLSYVLAETGKRVLLIDADLRVPSIARKMNVNSTPGLSDFLLEIEAQTLTFQKTREKENWYILPAGELPPNPSELLGSRKMEKILQILAEKFDYIVVDLPPVGLVSDALAISKFITGMVLVVREDCTVKSEFDACVRQMKLSEVNVLGCIVNCVHRGKGGYGKYKNYRSYKEYREYGSRS